VNAARHFSTAGLDLLELIEQVISDFPAPHAWHFGLCDCGRFRCDIDGPLHGTGIVVMTAEGIRALGEVPWTVSEHGNDLRQAIVQAYGKAMEQQA
jgi:hypothetical protein